MTWKIVEEHYYERFKIFQIKRSKRINPRSGDPFEFFLMEGLDWVNVIAITGCSELVLVRQFRHGINALTLELPGGCVEAGEDPARSAERELLEETGYQAASFDFLGTFHPNPAMQSMRAHCFVARNAQQVNAQSLDAGEDIEVITRPLSALPAMIAQGEITHGVVLAAISLYLVSNGRQLL